MNEVFGFRHLTAALWSLVFAGTGFFLNADRHNSFFSQYCSCRNGHGNEATKKKH